MAVVGAVTMAVKVECDACGKHITVDDVFDDTDLTAHVRLHITEDANFRKQFNDSPITFPIQYSEVIEGEEDGR